MKKTLIALTALASTSAFAQSSVTLYGKAAIGLAKQTGEALQLDGGRAPPQSRIGFRGAEDLGGGLKAYFLMESGLDLSDGKSDAVFWQRQSYVGISGGFGDLRVGRQETLGDTLSLRYIPQIYTSAQIRNGLDQLGAPPRGDGQITYMSPQFNGLQVQFSTQPKGNASAPLTELALAYDQGPVRTVLYANKRKNTDGTTLAFNASYDFGTFRVAGGYVDKAGDKTGKGGFIHLDTYIGSFRPYIQYSQNTDTEKGALEFGSRYTISKRTAAFVNTVSYTERGVDKRRSVLGMEHNF